MSNAKPTSILARHIRVDADVLHIAGDAAAEAADELDAGGDPHHAAQKITRATSNAVVSALGLARKAGELDA